MHAVGWTPGTDAAYTGAVQLPFGGKVAGNSGASQWSALTALSSVAPPIVRSSRVSRPVRTLSVAPWLPLGMLQTPASHLSTQTFATLTESGGQTVPCRPTAAGSTSVSVGLQAARILRVPERSAHTTAPCASGEPTSNPDAITTRPRRVAFMLPSPPDDTTPAREIPSIRNLMRESLAVPPGAHVVVSRRNTAGERPITALNEAAPRQRS